MRVSVRALSTPLSTKDISFFGCFFLFRFSEFSQLFSLGFFRYIVLYKLTIRLDCSEEKEYELRFGS